MRPRPIVSVLVTQLREQQAEAAKLDAAIATNFKELGYGG
jgi:type I restriction enzyme M protein